MWGDALAAQLGGGRPERDWAYPSHDTVDFSPYDFPIVTDMDFGHTSPQFTLPIGCRARVDAGPQTFEILEPAVL